MRFYFKTTGKSIESSKKTEPGVIFKIAICLRDQHVYATITIF